MNWDVIRDIIARALAEDIGPGDVTTRIVLSGNETGTARAVAKSPLTIAGCGVFRGVFHAVDPHLTVEFHNTDGETVAPGSVIAHVMGRLASILMAERTALNFFQCMSGIATATRLFVRALEGTKTRLLDTRKTVPGLRILDKYAVRVGGGCNHRYALFDGILIKENHITAAGGIREALSRARQSRPPTLKIEIEVKNLAELAEAIAGGAEIVMLDNMPVEEMRQAVAIAGGRVPLEASGGITLERVREIAQTGIDFISVGCLTHSVQAADISLLVYPSD